MKQPSYNQFLAFFPVQSYSKNWAIENKVSRSKAICPPVPADSIWIWL